MPSHELLSAYPVAIEIPVAWGEMDAFGHVNNVVYFRYFENARLAYILRTGMMTHMDETGIGPILAHIECRFRAPVKYPDTVLVGARAHSIEADRFKVDYRLVSLALDRVAAEGTSTVVMYDYRKGVKAPVPTIIRERIEAIETTP